MQRGMPNVLGRLSGHALKYWIWARDVMEVLDEVLASDILLVTGESFNGNKDGGGGDDEDVESMDAQY